MVRQWKEDFPIIHLIGPTAGDVRDVMVEGPAGILHVCPPWDRPRYEPSKRKVTFNNGTVALLFSADEPERLRGPQCYKAWADEPAAWRYPEAWDQMMFGLRLGSKPQVVATTTPKPRPLIKDLVKRDSLDVAVTRGSTMENKTNLAAAFFNTVIRKYEGTRLGRQELEAEILEDVEGALWTSRTIEASRMRTVPLLDHVVIGVDPPAADPTSDEMTEEEKRLNAECGIIAAGMAKPTSRSDGRQLLPHGYVMGDYSMDGSPEQWGRRVVNAFQLEMADCVVAEANQGGAMVRSVIHNVDPNVPVQLVYASRGKRTRAEPVSAMYEQARIHHIGYFPDLEAQLTTWIPGDKSPDRMDALVWAITKLLIGIPRSVGRLASRS
jgi:phage terminase large subunit-like protein